MELKLKDYGIALLVVEEIESFMPSCPLVNTQTWQEIDESSKNILLNLSISLE